MTLPATRRLLVVLLSCVPLFACGSVDAPELDDGAELAPLDDLDDLTTGLRMGETQRLASPDNGNAGVLIAQSASLAQTGTLTRLSIYVSQARGKLTLGVYDDYGPSGGPGALLATTAVFTPVVGWNRASVTQQVTLAAGRYWLAYLPTSNRLTTAIGTSSASSGVYYYRGFGSLPPTFATAPQTTNLHWSFYASLVTPTTDGGSDPTPPPPTTTEPPPTTTEPPPPPPSSGFALGQVPFAASSSWNTPIPASTSYTNVNWPASTGYNYTVTWNGYSAAIFVSTPTDPMVQVSYPASWGYPGGTLNIRMPAAADGAPGTDGELVIIDGTKAHNFWIFKRTSLTTATAQAYGVADIVSGSGWGSTSPFLSAGITAVGSSQLAGILIQAETDAGEILHALNLRGDGAIVAPGVVGQAISSDGYTQDGVLQEGQRYAIPRTTPMPSGLSPLGEKVFRALQSYGAYVTDVSGGCTTLGAQQNAYDDATMTALWHDSGKVIPLLKKVPLP